MSEIIGPYKILQECGRGSCGTVYLAQNTFSGQRSALKILDEKVEARELEGLIRCRECRHANLIQIHHLDRLPDGRLYYTMDPADDRGTGGTYQPDTLGARGRIPAEELLPILRALLDGVAALHGRKIIHRDIKPDNILFVNGVPVLGDIGLAAVSGDASLAGTPSFLPPEVLAGTRKPDERSDLYALGRTAYAVLTGNPPGKYPQIPADLPREAAPILAFCRAANAKNAVLRSCREALDAPPRGRSVRARWYAFIILAAVAAAAAVLPALRHVRTAPPPAQAEPAQSPPPPVPVQKQEIPAPQTGPDADAVLKNTEAELAKKMRQLDRDVAASQERMRTLFRELTSGECDAAVAELERRYPVSPDLLRQADARYGLLHGEYFRKAAGLSPFTAEGASARTRLNEEQKQLEARDALYRLGRQNSTLKASIRAFVMTRRGAHLANLEKMFRERQKTAEQLSNAAPGR